MTNQEAIDTIKAHWPPANCPELREALMMALRALDDEDDSRRCSYYEHNKTKPYCTHDCYGCMWYV